MIALTVAVMLVLIVLESVIGNGCVGDDHGETESGGIVEKCQ